MTGPGDGHPVTSVPGPLRPMMASPGDTALFLDFDGTLAAVVEDPRDARPLPGVPELLADLARPFALVGVISGRPTAFLAEVLGRPDGVLLEGLYGLERALRGPELETWATVIDAVVAEAQAEAPPGVYVEPKGLTVTLHWRRAPEHRQWVLDFAQRQHAARDLVVHPGRAERELRPPLHVDKGTVVRALVAEHDSRPGRGRWPTRPPSATTSAICRPSPRSTSCTPPRATALRWSRWRPSMQRARPRWRTAPISPWRGPPGRWRCCGCWRTRPGRGRTTV